MSDKPADNGESVLPSDSDFLASRARERAECRRRHNAERQELETKLYAPLREHRGEWSAAWVEVCAALAPLWQGWQDHTANNIDPDVPATAAALVRVGRAILRHDEITAPQTEYRVDVGVPRSLVGRLAWVEERRVYFSNEPPVLATALVQFALSAPPEAVAARIELLLSEPDDRPAFGWLPFIRDCLWPHGAFAEPVDPIEDRDWPGWRRVHVDDYRRLQYLLWPSAVPHNLADLFPKWRDPQVKLPAAGASVECANAVEHVDAVHFTDSCPTPPAEPAAPGAPSTPVPSAGSNNPAVPPIPPFERLLPDYITHSGFAARVADRYRDHPLPSLPTDYSDALPLAARDYLMEMFDALNRAVYWERAIDLLDFRRLRIGSFEDLAALESWGPTLLRHYIEKPEDAFVVSILLFDSLPVLPLETPSFGQLAPGAGREVPVLDHRCDPVRWLFPFTAGVGWTESDLRSHVIAQIDARRFCRHFRWWSDGCEDVSAALARSALVYARPAERDQPDAVLRRLIESMWDTMRDVSMRARLTTPLPPRPPSTAAPLDQFDAAFDALGNWLRDTRQRHPEFVEPIHAETRRSAEVPSPDPTDAAHTTTLQGSPPRAEPQSGIPPEWVRPPIAPDDWPGQLRRFAGETEALEATVSIVADVQQLTTPHHFVKTVAERWRLARQLGDQVREYPPDEPHVSNAVDFRNAMHRLARWANEAAKSATLSSGERETAFPHPSRLLDRARRVALDLIRQQVAANSLTIRTNQIADALQTDGLSEQRAAVLLELERDGILIAIPNPPPDTSTPGRRIAALMFGSVDPNCWRIGPAALPIRPTPTPRESEVRPVVDQPTDNAGRATDAALIVSSQNEEPTNPASPPRVQQPSRELKPDEFDFGVGAPVGDFSSKQLQFLRLIARSGTRGLALALACRELGYSDDEKGRKALGQLVSRTQEKIDAGQGAHLIELINGHYCLAPTNTLS